MSQPFSAWYPLKGHTYVNKLAYVGMTFQQIPSNNGLTYFSEMFSYMSVLCAILQHFVQSDRKHENMGEKEPLMG